MINPAAIPQFTGNLEELEGAASGLKGDAGDIAETGGDIHSTFQGLSAFYDAPEADQLFASTRPVADTAKSFGHDVEQVASALSDYAHEVRPIADTLKRLKAEATTFYDDVKDDDDWQYDGDKVARNNDLLHQVDVAVAAFWAAERKAANRIDALFGGTRYVANDGSNASNMYGYSADQLDHAKLPWGSSEEEKHHWYEVGHWIKSFVWDGLIVDGVWGTLKGLGGLAGFQGWDTFVASWKGLGELGIGLASYGFGIPGVQQAAMAVPDSWLPGWVQESRKTTREAGKALLAWDEWGHNPARAAGAVTFNVLTVLAGGEGMAAKAGGLGKVGGGVARVADVLGKAGRVIDPMTYVVKGVGKLPKISEITKALDGLKTGDIQGLDDLAKVDGVELPDGSVKMPDGTVLHPNGEVHLPNGEVHAPSADVHAPARVPAHAEVNEAHGGHDLPGGATHGGHDIHNSTRTAHEAPTHMDGAESSTGHSSQGDSGSHGTTESGAADGGDPPTGQGRDSGDGDGPPKLVRQDDDFQSDQNHKGQRKAHLNVDGDLVPANPNGTSSILDHIAGWGDKKSNSPYISLSREGASAKAFGSSSIRVDLPRLEHDIKAGRVRGVTVISSDDIRAAIQADVDRIAGRHVDITLSPNASRAEIQDLARSFGLNRSGTNQIRQRIMDMKNTRRDEEWLIKGIVPHEYIEGPFSN